MITAHSVLSLCLWLFHRTYGMPSCVKIKVSSKWQMLSHVWLFANPWTAYQAPLSMGFPRQEYWSGLILLLQGIFLTQDQTWVCRIVGRFFTSLYQGSSTISLAIRKMLVKTISYHSFFFWSAWLWGLSSPTRDWTQALISENMESNQWKARELPTRFLFFFLNLSDWQRYKTLLILSVGKDVRRYCTNVNQWQLIFHSTSWKAVYRNAWTYAETCPRILTSVIYSTKNWKQSKYQ